MSRIYVDRISPYQSGSLTIDGFSPSVDTGSLVTTASFNAYTQSQSNINDTLATTGSNTFAGNQVITGLNSSPANTLDVKDGNNTSILQVNNATIKGFTGVDVLINGDTLHNGKLSLSGSLDLGEDVIVRGTNAAPEQTFIVEDGNGTSILQVNNATLKGFTGVDVVLNGIVLVDEIVSLVSQDPLPTPSPTAGGSLAVSGSNLYFHNGTSWNQIS